jgi:hypothetical protein
LGKCFEATLRADRSIDDLALRHSEFLEKCAQAKRALTHLILKPWAAVDTARAVAQGKRRGNIIGGR